MSSETRAQVLAATDIVDLIGQTVALKRRGKDFLGLCPFHQEKTPSFHVNPMRQAFYCFGCKAGGTAFDFVMKRDRLEFRDALEVLARKAGIEMPKFGGAASKPGERQALLDAHSAACRFFENQLFAEPRSAQAQAAHDYLQKRGFTAETLRKFQVGLAPNGWDGLLRSTVGQKFAPQMLAMAGLVKVRDGGDGHYDTFRNRIMFPIRSEGGQIIAFGGRVMPGSDDPAKYLNSPETPLFSKGRSVFGLDLARQKIVESRAVAVVEGYTDVVMAHQFGAANVVSVLGTAMTEQHVATLRRFADRIVLLFDADSAGDAAVDRVVQLFLTQPVEIAVAQMPAGLDPDEFLLKEGLEGFDKLLADATDALEYAWRQLVKKFDAGGGDLTKQQMAAAQYLEILSGVRGGGPIDSLRWGAALARVSRLTEIPVEELHRRFKSSRAKQSKAAARLKYDGQEVSVESEPSSAPAAEIEPMTGRARAEQFALGALLLEPGRWHGVQFRLDVEDFTQPELKKLADVYWNCQRDEGEPVFNEFLDRLSDSAMKTMAIELVEMVDSMSDLEGALEGALEYIAGTKRRLEVQKLAALARSDERALTEQEQIELLTKAQDFARKPDLRRAAL